MPPLFSGSPEKAPTLMLVTSSTGGENWWLNLLINRSCRQFTAAPVPLTSRIFLRGSKGDSAGLEQFVEDANRNKAWTSLIRLFQPLCFFAACCVTRDSSLITAVSLYVAATSLSFMCVDCGEMLGRRYSRQLLKKSSSFGCTGTEIHTDISTSPQAASHQNWRRSLECKQGLDSSCCEELENWMYRERRARRIAPGSDNMRRHCAIVLMKHGGTGVMCLLLNLISTFFLKS